MKIQHLKNIQTEIDASYLYKLLSDHEENESIANVFRQMSEIEYSHAVAFAKANNLPLAEIPSPSTRAKALKLIGKIFGYNYVLGVLLDTEKSISQNILQSRKNTQTNTSISDTAHVTILKNILNNTTQISGPNLAKFETRHRSIGGNALRAAVLGGNDGLVSNFSLIMGVAGASSGQKEVLLAGIAGLLAGALSMALGEWISVKSSQELTENQMELEMDELETNPEGEEKELALIYITKGIPETEARLMATNIMMDKNQAHQILVKEELGISVEDLKNSAFEAAYTSFILFAIGAAIPIIPYFFTGGTTAILISAILSTFGLFGIGAIITLFTGKTVLFSGFRQVAFGLLAALITFGIGRFIGISIMG